MAGPVDLEELYGLERSEFIAARDALARHLRSAGRREEAAAVKQARKPTLAAWALNQVARRHPDEVAALRRAGAALAGEQHAALAGDSGGLREAGRALAEAVDRVASLAAGFLDAPSPLQRERMAATLRAAATDEAGGDLLRRGVLVEDLEPAGFGLPGGDATAAGDVPGAAHRAPRRRPPASSRPGPSEAVDAARRDLRRLQAEAEAAESRARRRAERAEAAARRAAEAHREAEVQRAEAEDAAAEAVAARRAAEEAAARLADVAGTLDRGPDAT